MQLCNDQSDDALCIVVLGGWGRGAPQFWKDTCVDSDFVYTSLKTLMQTWAMQTWAKNMLSQSWASLVLRHLTLLTVPHKPLCTAQDTYVPHPNHSARQKAIAPFSIGGRRAWHLPHLGHRPKLQQHWHGINWAPSHFSCNQLLALTPWRVISYVTFGWNSGEPRRQRQGSFQL